MIFLSILAKTFALALGSSHLWLAVVIWVAGVIPDVVVARRDAGKGTGNGKGTGGGAVAGKVALFNVAALVIGFAAAEVCAYAAMRWKDGIPILSHLLGGLLRLVGLPAGVHEGRVFLTNMAGPLEFAASIDHLGLRVPGVFLALSAVWLLGAAPSLRRLFGHLAAIAGGLVVVMLLRTGLWVLLIVGLSDFVGYETDELPFRPFVDEAAMVWLYLPFLLAGGVLLGRFLPAPAAGARTPLEIPRAIKWGGTLALLLLFGLILWEPAGTPKTGKKVVISTFHTQWSRTDRPYDRDWYGADSGYNYACLKRLYGVHYPVVEATGRLRAADLEDASVLIIYVPDRSFTREERELVQEFVRGGGGLFVIGDHTNVFGSTSNLNELCAPFGFQYRDDVLFDLDEDFHQVIEPPRRQSQFWHGMAMFKLRGPASIRPTALSTRSVYEIGNSKSVRAIYSVNNFYPPPHDHPRMKTGDFCVAAAARYGRGRVAAWGDSTVFSNFEIFYPGKYEYLLNTLHWLNHKDGLFGGLLRRILPLVLLAGLAVFLGRRRDPRVWLGTLAVTVVAFYAARGFCSWQEERRAVFPEPVQPSDWVFFAAHLEDPGHKLQDFIAEGPYNERYEVFIQWVLRTGAFSGFHLLGPEHVKGFHEHLRDSEEARTALALIVRKPDDLPQLDELGSGPARHGEPLLLLFASSIPAEEAIKRLKQAGLVTSDEALAKVAGAWPSGEVLIDDGGRRLMVVAGAERFSDQSMGISEKVTPNPQQRALFDQAFSIVDRFLGREAPTGGSAKEDEATPPQ